MLNMRGKLYGSNASSYGSNEGQELSRRRIADVINVGAEQRSRIRAISQLGNGSSGFTETESSKKVRAIFFSHQ